MESNNDIVDYDFIPELYSTDDIRLIKRDAFIWIGVLSSTKPSPPCPRNSTDCFVKCPVYFYRGRSVFSINGHHNKNELDFYYVPDSELHLIKKY